MPDEPATIEVVIVDYDPAWPQRFDDERVRIEAALGERAIAIDHIGSTSVPGLAAKPIVDICLTVADSGDEDAYVPALTAAGYELHIREPEFHEHRMFRTPARNVQIHVFTAGSSEITRYLLLRDRLRTDRADRELYESLKRTLAQRRWPTMDHY